MWQLELEILQIHYDWEGTVLFGFREGLSEQYIPMLTNVKSKYLIK